MKKIQLCFSLLVIIFYLETLPVYPQLLPNDSTGIKKKDTVCFKLAFHAGDTLTYSIVSMDSIVINYGAPLKKVRNELLSVVCDSVSKKGTFFLSLELLDFIGYESSDGEKEVERKETPWKGRIVQIEIDSVGNRLSWSVDDSTVGAMSTGGAFQPYLFFYFKEPCKGVDETWMVQTLDELPENGFPVPLLKQSSLFRARKDIDTLGEKCSSFEFIKTGQGSINVIDEKTNLLVTSIINSFGIYDISQVRNIPVYFYYTVEQKLTVHLSKDETQPGWHYITSNWTLSQYKPFDAVAASKIKAETLKKLPPKKYIKKRK